MKTYPPASKAAFVAEFHKSGQTQTAFCKQHGLVIQTFNKWVKERPRKPLQILVTKGHNTDHDTLQETVRQSSQRQAVESPFPQDQSSQRQATFIPIHQNKGAFPIALNQPHHQPSHHLHGEDLEQSRCIQSKAPLSAPLPPPCSSSPFDTTPSVPILSLKINGFCLDIPANLSSTQLKTTVRSLIEVLHPLTLPHQA